MEIKIESSVTWVKNNWANTEGLIVFLIAAASASVAFAALLHLEALGIVITLIASLLGVTVFWGLLRMPPRVKEGKIGFAVAINCDDDLRPKVRDDFVMALRSRIRGAESNVLFDFLEVPSHYANRIVDQRDAESVRRKMRSHFLLAGRVRRRKIDQKEHDVINIIALVAHAPIPIEVSNQISQEFTALMPGQLIIEPENSFPALEFTAEWAELVAKYIIGIAAAASKDFEYAKSMFLEVRNSLRRTNAGFLIYEQLKKRISIHLTAIAIHKANKEFLFWRDTKEKRYLEQAGVFIEEASLEDDQNLPQLIMLGTIHFFLVTRDASNALKRLKNVKKKNRDGVWHLNAAFLNAFDGKLKEASQHYRAADGHVIPSDEFDTVAQVEDFLVWVASETPDKVQMYYCLGVVNWLLKGDKEQACKDFESFLSKCPEDQFENERMLVRKWLGEIQINAPAAS